MNNMPSRDTTGECAGECRNTVREGEVRRQDEIEASGIPYPESTRSVSQAFSRNEAPGSWGGRV
jgi:hypothetical protein